MITRAWLSLRLALALGVLALGWPGWGQSPAAPAGGAEDIAAPASVAPPFPVKPPYPFGVGEKLTYEFSFSRFPLSGKLGELELEVVSLEEARAAMDALAARLKRSRGEACPSALPASCLAFQARARTRGFLPALLRIDARNEYLSVVDACDLGLVYNQRSLRSHRRQRFQMTCQARAAETRAIVESDEGERAPISDRALPARRWTTDLQTFWHVLRSQPLAPGATIPMVLTEDDRVYDLPVVVTNEVELIQTRAGRFRARKLELKAYESGFSRYEGTFFLWLSEDAARLPARVRFKARGVTVTGELVSYVAPPNRAAGKPKN
ncbi:MAG: hypothetical protein CFK52_11880 [Chloracidobacterium sp. CP2_5A]|nr:MAG: hypothetical protein CFK52_11880 [Chloracidobacterium sp. CP2_5A]